VYQIWLVRDPAVQDPLRVVFFRDPNMTGGSFDPPLLWRRKRVE
jgi:hypothetical protein